MARRFKVEATRDYLYYAIALFLLFLWSVRDGWFPSQSVLKKHPLEVVASFQTGGLIEEVLVVPGQSVNEKQTLVRLRRPDLAPLVRASEDAKARLQAAGNAPPTELRSAAETAARILKEARDRAESMDLISPANGIVLAVEVSRLESVPVGGPAVRIRPRDSFFIFNKSLAVLALLGALIFAGMYWMDR
jgi:multidrug resistance efflux pump